MITAPQTLQKLVRLEQTYDRLIYEPVQTLDVRIWETDEHRRQVPGPDVDWKPCLAGAVWGKAWGSAWFVTDVRVSGSVAGHALYLMARTGAVEAMFWLDGQPSGIFNFDPFIRNRGDHRAQLIATQAESGRTYQLAVEGYAGHPTQGSQPLDRLETQGVYPYPFVRRFERMELCLRHEDINAFVLDLRALNQLVTALPAESFRRGAVAAALARVFEIVYQDPGNAPREAWREALAGAREIMRPLLACRNGDSAPFAGLVGHSHLDTAWHWPVDEAIRKFARTSSNALRMMEQYPEYRYIQSSSLHLDWMRRLYPSIFEGIRQRVAEGRWEPNGGTWIEPDVNLTGGEALIRHFLWGQSFTQEHFGFRSDTFWLPDSFGYSGALPQIMRGCGIAFFLTTKLTWNETNTFPYDTFWWEGIDGSRVFAHFNDIHCAPDPATLINKLHGSGPRDFRVVENCVRHKDVNNRRLISYGLGDGGGGPDAQMIEMARRCRDLEGCPRAEHVPVSRFMSDLRDQAVKVPTFAGELYFEGHRGTLTQMHEIKRRNRRAEGALREAEFLSVLAGSRFGESRRESLRALWAKLLLNQFHDILPGTSIAEVHDRAVRELGEVMQGAGELAVDAAHGLANGDQSVLTLFNSLGWERHEAVLRGIPQGRCPDAPGVVCQAFETPWGEERMAAHGLALPALGARSFGSMSYVKTGAQSPFSWDGEQLITPHLRVLFDPAGGLASVRDLETGRELRHPDGLPLNTFLFGEDMPSAWDNWDVDADLALKLKPVLRLSRRERMEDGPLQLRIRQHYQFGTGSALVQDVVFHAHSSRIDFDTRMDWDEKHRFLASVFPLNLCASSARHEIQFGHIERPTRRNFAEDRERFEVAQQKWTELSENRFGVALLNDGKYGVSVSGSTLRLSLHKGGCHPDGRGDAGCHITTYSLCPHQGGFSAEGVVRPAYELNLAPLVVAGALERPLVRLPGVDAPNIIVETVKPSEDGSGFVLRLYECERQATRTALRFAGHPAEVALTNLLEEDPQPLTVRDGVVELVFRPFEIKTVRIRT